MERSFTYIYEHKVVNIMNTEISCRDFQFLSHNPPPKAIHMSRFESILKFMPLGLLLRHYQIRSSFCFFKSCTLQVLLYLKYKHKYDWRYQRDEVVFFFK